MKNFVFATLAAFVTLHGQAEADTCSTTVTCNGAQIADLKKLVSNYGRDAGSCPTTSACNNFKTAAGGSPKCSSLDFSQWLGGAKLGLTGVSVLGWLGDSGFETCTLTAPAGKCSC